MIRFYFRDITRTISIIYFDILLLKVSVCLNMTVLLNKTATSAKTGNCFFFFYPHGLEPGTVPNTLHTVHLITRYLIFPTDTAWFILYYVILFSFLCGLRYYVKDFFLTCLMTNFFSKNWFNEILFAILSRTKASCWRVI